MIRFCDKFYSLAIKYRVLTRFNDISALNPIYLDIGF